MATNPPLQIPEFLADFLKFEVELDLFSQMAAGRRFWDYVRYAVNSYSIYQRFAFEEPRQSRSGAILGELAPTLAGVVRERFRPARRYDLVLVAYGRTARIDGRNVNIHAYPLIEHLATRMRILLIDPQPLSVDVEALYPCDVLRSRPSHLLDRFRTKAVTFSAADRSTFRGIAEALARRYDVRLDIEAIAREVFLFPLQRMRWYREVLSACQPRAVLYCDDANQKALIEVAHELGVAAIDLQHSLISSSNILYLYPKEIDRPLSTMSDFIFTYGEFWNDHYQLPVPRKAVGFPYFEQQRARARQQVGAAGAKAIIIIGMVFSKDDLIRLALDLSALLPDYTIYYKLRFEDYEEWQDRYPKEFATRENLVVIDSNDPSLYEWFARCSYQIGINSTALCEGLGFGLTTFILNVGWYREMEHFYEGGNVFLVANARQVADIIAGGIRPTQPLDEDALFKTNALGNIEAAIRDVTTSQRVSA